MSRAFDAGSCSHLSYLILSMALDIGSDATTRTMPMILMQIVHKLKVGETQVTQRGYYAGRKGVSSHVGWAITRLQQSHEKTTLQACGGR